jgi:hypothetical protein
MVVFLGQAVDVIEATGSIERGLLVRNPTQGVVFSFSRVAKATSSKYSAVA